MALLIDASIVIVYFAGIIFLGLYMGRRESSLADFALGGRKVPWWAVMASIIAAETSAATFLGAPGEGYTSHNFAYLQLILGLIIGRVFVGFVFLKPYYDYKVYTVYDFLAVRFGKISKYYVSALFLIMRTLASGSRLFVPSLVMVLAYRLFTSGQNSIEFKNVDTLGPYFWMIVVITLLTCVYTAVGGIKAVIWTDLVQASVMFGSACVAIVTILYHLGGDSWNLLNGFHALTAHVPEMSHLAGSFTLGWEDRLSVPWMKTNHVDHMNAWQWLKLTLVSPYTLASALIAATAANAGTFGTDQDMVQRMLTAETYKKARRSLITAALADIPIAGAFVFIGILLAAYFQVDPTFKPTTPNQVFGSYILNVLPTGIRGIVLAGVFSTAMGSLSTALNALATSLTNDWYIPFFGRGKSEAHLVNFARFSTALFAILMIAIATFFARATIQDPNVRIIPVVLGIAGFIIGPMFGVFLLGMLTKRRGSDMGNAIAITVGLCATIYLGGLHVDVANMLGIKISPPPLTVSFAWFALIGAAVVIAVGIWFRTPESVVINAQRQASLADVEQDVPLALRTDVVTDQPGFPLDR